MASIAFTDGTGAATLDNGLTAIAGGVGSRFRGWTSLPRVVGPRRYALGSGVPAVFRFRTDYLATFELPHIPQAQVTVLDRLMAHLASGGTCSVATGDDAARTYPTCALAEGAEPEKRLSDPQDLRWSLVLTLVNVAGSPVPMTCLYS